MCVSWGICIKVCLSLNMWLFFSILVRVYQLVSVAITGLNQQVSLLLLAENRIRSEPTSCLVLSTLIGNTSHLILVPFWFLVNLLPLFSFFLFWVLSSCWKSLWFSFLLAACTQSPWTSFPQKRCLWKDYKVFSSSLVLCFYDSGLFLKQPKIFCSIMPALISVVRTVHNQQWVDLAPVLWAELLLVRALQITSRNLSSFAVFRFIWGSTSMKTFLLQHQRTSSFSQKYKIFAF